MAAKEHLQRTHLRKQRFDRRHFNAYCPILITTYHLDQVIRIRIDDVIMQFQDGHQKYLQCSYLRNQCSDRRHFKAYCTISITTYHCDHVINIRIDDAIMQCQDGRQITPQETLVRPQMPQ